MWLNLISMGMKTASHIYQNKQKTKRMMSDAQAHHAERMAKGEIEYKPSEWIDLNTGLWWTDDKQYAKSYAYPQRTSEIGHRKDIIEKKRLILRSSLFNIKC